MDKFIIIESNYKQECQIAMRMRTEDGKMIYGILHDPYYLINGTVCSNKYKSYIEAVKGIDVLYADLRWRNGE